MYATTTSTSTIQDPATKRLENAINVIVRQVLGMFDFGDVSSESLKRVSIALQEKRVLSSKVIEKKSQGKPRNEPSTIAAQV